MSHLCFSLLLYGNRNALERFYLIAMQFNVSVKSSVFAARYFDLREFARKSNARFDLQPLSEADANELEVLLLFVFGVGEFSKFSFLRLISTSSSSH